MRSTPAFSRSMQASPRRAKSAGQHRGDDLDGAGRGAATWVPSRRGTGRSDDTRLRWRGDRPPAADDLTREPDPGDTRGGARRSSGRRGRGARPAPRRPRGSWSRGAPGRAVLRGAPRAPQRGAPRGARRGRAGVARPGRGPVRRTAGRAVGGASSQTLDPSAQLLAKVDMVGRLPASSRSHRRAGGAPGPALAAEGFRTTLRLRWRRRPGSACAAPASHELVPSTTAWWPTRCSTSSWPRASFAGADEVTLRVGAATGERMAVVGPSAAGVRLPDDVLVVGLDELRRGPAGLDPRGGRRSDVADLGGVVLPDPARRGRGAGGRGPGGPPVRLAGAPRRCGRLLRRGAVQRRVGRCRGARGRVAGRWRSKRRVVGSRCPPQPRRRRCQGGEARRRAPARAPGLSGGGRPCPDRSRGPAAVPVLAAWAAPGGAGQLRSGLGRAATPRLLVERPGTATQRRWWSTCSPTRHHVEVVTTMDLDPVP